MPEQPKDIVCFYADLGRPYYPLIERMTRTAKEVMPEVRTVLLTGTDRIRESELFDVTVELPVTPTAQSVCFDKVRAIMSWQAKSPSQTIFCDPDVEFRKPVVFPDADVGLLWRKSSAQPVNTGMILTRPGAQQFWTKYGSAAANLPKELRAWWCDQLAFSILLGCIHEVGDELTVLDAKVKLIDMKLACAKIEDASEETWSIHHKGSRKGPEWFQWFGSPKLCGGKPSLGSASSMDTGAA